jgi:hypothetical protein
MEATKLPLTTWFLDFYLIGQAKTVISSLALMRQLGVHYRTAWLIHNKIMESMREREEAYLLRGKVQVDDAYLGGERYAGKAGRRSENKVSVVAAVSIDHVGHPLHVKLETVRSLSPPLLTGAKRSWPVVVRCSAMVWPASVLWPKWAALISPSS